MYKTTAWAKESAGAPFTRITIERNEPGDKDVQFDVVYCGICHTDVHYADPKSPLPRPTLYPLVPGHELAGIVTKVGREIDDIRVGEKVGVGCISDSCQNCGNCEIGDENVCEKGFTMTYNSAITHKNINTNTGYTLGGYSKSITVHRKYIVKIPESYKLEMAGPVLCSGITMYSPLKHWGCTSGGKRVGIVGIGGLGQMGIRLAKTMGNEVTAISTSPQKEGVAREIGADHFVISSDAAAMKGAAMSLDVILNTVSAPHNLTALINLLKRDGTIVQLGAVAEPHSINQLIFFRRVNLSGSVIGGMRDTQECIQFCADHNIMPTIQIISSNGLDEVFEKLGQKNDQVVRYVLDINGSM